MLSTPLFFDQTEFIQVNITKTDNGNLTSVVTITISNEDYAQPVKQSLKKYAKEANIKGFRQGKVPTGIIKKMYGNSVLADELSQMASKKIDEYIKEEKIDYLGQLLPLPLEEIIDINEDKTYNFQFEIGLAPKFEYQVDSSPFTHYKVEVTDEMIDEDVLHYQKQFGSISNPDDGIVEDDVIMIDLQELGEDGKVNEEAEKISTSFAVNMFKDGDFKNELLTKKLNDSLNIDVFESIDKSKEDIAKQFLNLNLEEIEDIETVPTNYEMTITDVRRMTPAELNQELFDKIYGEGTCETVEQFRDKIKEQISNIFEDSAKKLLKNEFIEHTITQNDISLPDDFLKKMYFSKKSDEDSTKEPELDTERIEKEYEMFRRGTKWELISTQIFSKNNITIEREEIEAHAKQAVIRQFASWGGAGLDESMYDKFVQNMLSDRKYATQMYNEIAEIKIFDAIWDNINKEEKVVDKDEFQEIIKNKNEEYAKR